MSQGFEANHSGKHLESMFEREFKARGFIFRAWVDDADNLDLFASKIVITNVPYRSLYGCQSRSEFLICEGRRKIRVECRWQEVSGSVDEKFIGLMRNAIECMPEPEILIFHGGNGARQAAIDWTHREADRCGSKKIHVVSPDEFPRWVRNEFVQKPKGSWSEIWSKPFYRPELI